MLNINASKFGNLKSLSKNAKNAKDFGIDRRKCPK